MIRDGNSGSADRFDIFEQFIFFRLRDPVQLNERVRDSDIAKCCPQIAYLMFETALTLFRGTT